MTEAATYVKNMNKWEAAMIIKGSRMGVPNMDRENSNQYGYYAKLKSTKPLKPFKRRKKSV